jgi:hypothetical protein
MNSKLLNAAADHAKAVSPKGVKQERDYIMGDFVAGAEWQQAESRAAEIDPIPAWFGLVPIDPTMERSLKH